MQLSFGVDRDVKLSYDQQYPFYVEQGAEGRTIIRFLPQFDLLRRMGATAADEARLRVPQAVRYADSIR